MFPRLHMHFSLPQRQNVECRRSEGCLDVGKLLELGSYLSFTFSFSLL